jgi:hypothetical protein
LLCIYHLSHAPSPNPNVLRETLILKEKEMFTRHQWLMPVILATQEAENRGIAVQSQPWQTVLETLS